MADTKAKRASLGDDLINLVGLAEIKDYEPKISIAVALHGMTYIGVELNAIANALEAIEARMP